MSAVFSHCGRYRYRLDRIVDPAGGATVVWVMLNPSTADATSDDQTLRRVRGFSASTCGHLSRIVVVNLYAYRATNPAELMTAPDSEGPENARYVEAAVDQADRVIVGWGASIDRWRRREPSSSIAVLEGRELWCLGTARTGDPLHPLRVPSSRSLRRWSPRRAGVGSAQSCVYTRTCAS